jgi:hypothetical protein
LQILEVDVLDPQAEGLHEPHAGAVEEGEEETMWRLDLGEDSPDLALGEDERLAGAPGDADQAGEVGGLAEYFAVEEEESGEGL